MAFTFSLRPIVSPDIDWEAVPLCHNLHLHLQHPHCCSLIVDCNLAEMTHCILLWHCQPGMKTRDEWRRVLLVGNQTEHRAENISTHAHTTSPAGSSAVDTHTHTGLSLPIDLPSCGYVMQRRSAASLLKESHSGRRMRTNNENLQKIRQRQTKGGSLANTVAGDRWAESDSLNLL